MQISLTPALTFRTPSRTTPAGACDCHAHVFGAPKEYRRAASRSFEPNPWTYTQNVANYRAMLAAEGMERGVLIHSNVYDVDNSVTADAMAELGPQVRATALIGPDVTDAELDSLHAAGFRSVRVNLVVPGSLSLAELETIGGRLADRGWHVEILMKAADSLRDVAPILSRLPIPPVLDHMGLVAAAAGTDDAGFQEMLRLIGEGLIWVKLSGLYRLSARPDLSDLEAQVKALIAANPERLIYGSDWPFVQFDGPAPDPVALLDLVGDCCGDDSTYKRVLCDNPTALYGWA